MSIASSANRALLLGQVVALAGMGAFGLAACGEKPQLAGTATKKHDVEAYDGSVNTAFTAPGWKAGDEVSWEQQMKARNQNQNEYTRMR